jgi:hypothetical protein
LIVGKIRMVGVANVDEPHVRAKNHHRPVPRRIPAELRSAATASSAVAPGNSLAHRWAGSRFHSARSASIIAGGGGPARTF